MIPYQVEFAGAAFGRGDDTVTLLASGLDISAGSVRSNDVEYGDTIIPGRDYLTPPTLTLTLEASRDDIRQLSAWTVLEDLAAQWRGPSHRGDPGAVYELAVHRGEAARVVYGRPRDFTLVAPPYWTEDTVRAIVQFQMMDPWFYDAHPSSRTILAQPPPTSWYILPTVLPLTPAGGSGVRMSVMDVGTVPVPFTVEFTADNVPGAPPPSVSEVTLDGSPGWKVSLRSPVPPGLTATVDTRSGAVTVGGQTMQGALTLDSDPRAVLAPGHAEVSVTGAPSAIVRWRRGHASL